MGQNVIELNGKRYDAITGAYLGKSSVVPKHIMQQHVRGKVVDGFVRPARPAHKAEKQTEATKKPEPAKAEKRKPAAKAATAHKHTHAVPAHIKHHQPQRAKTLMRRAIKKPEFSLKPAIKIQPPAEIMAKPASAIAPKRSAYGVDPSRQERAAIVNKHHAVRHFGIPAIHSVSTQVPVIPVRPTPLQIAAPQPMHHSKPDLNVFEKALTNASSHLEPRHKHRKQRSTRRKLANTLATVAAFLVIGGFVGYLNLPRLQLQVASVQAGFGASMPAYAPTGYALENDIQRSGGTITLSFRSGESRFRITQQASNWNSQTLLDNTLALNGRHQTVQKNGQTIYVYENGGTSAAWVNGGVRYDITGNAQLSAEEIIAIATSM